MDVRALIFVIFTLFSLQSVAQIKNFHHFACNKEQQPSSEAYLKEYAPHLILHALDIDFMVKETGLCTSMLITLIEFQSGIVRSTRMWEAEKDKPFGQLSDKAGFLRQLIDVTEQIKQAQLSVRDDWIPVKQPFAFLFRQSYPPGTPARFVHLNQKVQFRALYRAMFMLEYHPLDGATRETAIGHGWSRARIAGWNMIRRYSSVVY